MKNQLLSIKKSTQVDFKTNYSIAHYSILVFKGKGRFLVDFIEYAFSGNTILFLSPYQNFQWLSSNEIEIQLLQFHGDFYCIEYHKQEVACNGLLFNNIYLMPHISVSEGVFEEIRLILQKMDEEGRFSNPYTDAVLKSYLQLVLALGSKEKSEYLESAELQGLPEKEIIEFQNLLEHHFFHERSASFYADKLAISTSSFSKKIKYQFGKTPTQLIQERVILEAKKLLHLTHKSIKEIATELHFDDEFYFSRYFKKGVGLSPLHYRENVGISIVAK